MDTREVSAKYRLVQWAQTIQARARSGKNIKEYCASSGISRNAYFYWQRKLREAACSEISETETKVRSGDSLAPSGWARLESADVDRAEDTVAIEVDGCRIIANAKTDLELLAKVCRALRSL